MAYVIYYDEKGKLRKETSWESWRDKKIEPVEYENSPIEGFVLNKKVGGYTNGWSNFRQAYVRVYDPRGFEFEITVPNLLYILENTNSIKGKGLEGEFVYGWDGTDLVLIPTSSPDYEYLNSLNQKRFDNKKILAKDLKIGATYLTKNNTEVVYLGKFNYYEPHYSFDGEIFSSSKKLDEYAKEHGKPIVIEKRRDEYPYYPYSVPLYTMVDCTTYKHYFFSSMDSGALINKKSISGWLIDVVSETCANDYAERMERLESSPNYSPYDKSKDKIVDYTLEELRNKCANYPYYDVTMAVQKDNNIYYIRLYRKNGRYVLRKLDNDEDSLDPRDSFDCNPNSWMPETYPMSIKDIFNAYNFVYINQYLANGKFYRRMY